jgi:uncharacterized Fe-S cluster protein YjdI
MRDELPLAPTPAPVVDDQSSASAGGTGAPPEENAPNRADKVTREYNGNGIRVLWYADRCIHAGECIRALPQVFDFRSRPWIRIQRASADAVADAVLRCPTGALHFERSDGGTPDGITPGNLTIELVPGGPYFVRGEVEVREEDGTLVRRDSRIALCRCGKSRRLPFCDNSHRAIT